MFTTNIVTVTEERCHVWGADSDNCSAHWQGLSHQRLLHLAYPQERWRPEEMLAKCPDREGLAIRHLTQDRDKSFWYSCGGMWGPKWSLQEGH